MKKEKGITMISLVITIVVMTILATIIVRVVSKEDTSIEESKNANEKVRLVSVEKARDMWIINDKEGKYEIEEVIKNLNEDKLITKAEEREIREKREVVIAGKTVSFKIEDNKGDQDNTSPHKNIEPGVIATENQKYIEKDENSKIERVAVIPKGFCVVKESSGLTHSIPEGLVISDKANDDLNNSQQGNQFVWIPVDKLKFEEEFSRGFWGDKESEKSKYNEVNRDGSNPIIEETDITKREAREMYRSVKQNGGFYIGRYEAGSNLKWFEIGTRKTLVKKGAYVNTFDYICWGDNIKADTTGDYALSKSRDFYKRDNSNYGAVSTLCYGVQWDAALRFITTSVDHIKDQNQKEKQKNYAKDSSGMGFYGKATSQNMARAGSSEDYKVNNIYDMAGNAWEWTMEIMKNDEYFDITADYLRVCRGGSYVGFGSSSPAQARKGTPNVTGTKGVTTGFRIALYIK